MRGSSKSKLSILSYGVKRRNQLAFFLSSIVPLIFLSYLALTSLFPELGDMNAIMSTGMIMIIALLILSLSGYYLTIKDTESLIERADSIQKRINNINEVILRGILYPTENSSFFLEQILDTAVQLTESSGGAVLLIEEEGMLSYVKASGIEGAGVEGTLVPVKIGIVGFCYNNKKGYFSNDTSKDSLFDLRSDRIGSMEIQSTLVVPVYTKNEPLGVIQLINKKSDEDYTDLDLILVNNLSLNIAPFLQADRRSDSKRDYLNEAAGILSTVLEANGLGKQHHQNVAKYADMIGEVMLDNSLEKDDLHLAALLHDIGIVFIEPHLRSNQEIYQRHPSIGADLLKKIPTWRNASICVQHHHENINGTGYPEGQVGEDIPLSSRILAVAEYYDYLTNSSFSDKPLSPEEAKFEIINCSGTYFDPMVVEVFAQVFEHFDKN